MQNHTIPEPDAYDGCFPPDHCELGAQACPVGRVCTETPTGSTSCEEQPDEPDPGPEPDAGVGDDGEPSGDDGADEDESDDGGPTTVHEDPSSDGEPHGKSKDGCNVRAGQDSPRGALATLLCLAGLGVVRRRRRSR